MGRLRLLIAVFAVVVSNCMLTACGGGGNGTTVTANPVPTSISLAPFSTASIELGNTLQFTATPTSNGTTVITTLVQFVSSDDSVVSVASNGLACAGTWDSLSTPQICTPGKVGTAQITAVAEGVSSSTTTVYVHQHVDNVTVSPVPSQTPLTANCISKGQKFLFQANAFSHGTDITSSVGPVAWSAASSTIITFSTLSVGLPTTQVQVTGVIPGITTLTASVGSANSIATPLTICPVESITLTANGSNSTNLSVPVGTTIEVNATVIDAAHNSIADVPLTWTSSNTGSVGVSGTSSTAQITTTLGGGATIVASCTPPNCNAGFRPSRPVYAENVVQVTSGAPGVTPSLTLLVTSDGCADASGCVSTLVPVTTSESGTTPPNSVGTPVSLGATPNSLLLAGGTAGSGYLGTNFSQQGTKGLMVLDSSNGISQFPSAPGKVLAVSPDGGTVIVSDTADAPNQLYLFKTSGNTSTPFSISGATAAAFSPDSLKAFVIAGTNLYIFSTQDALQIVPLSAPATDVAFLPQGGFAYISQGASLVPWQTCSAASVPGQSVSTFGVPQFVEPLNTIQEVPNGNQNANGPTFDQIQNLLAVDSPGIDLIAARVSLPATLGTCGLDLLSDPPAATLEGFFNLGRGNFIPTQLLLSTDGSKAYIVTSNLPVILVFNLNSRTSSAITLTNGLPLAAALTPDGGTLYVGSSDDTVHVIDTTSGLDIQQITFQQNFCRDTVGNSLPTPCAPDILAIRP
jgi:hypothetical protein